MFCVATKTPADQVARPARPSGGADDADQGDPEVGARERRGQGGEKKVMTYIVMAYIVMAYI